MVFRRSVAVVGVGSMGRNIARRLIDSPVTSEVCGVYDMNQSIVRELHEEAVKAGKSKSAQAPTSMKGAVAGADCVVVSLSGQDACHTVCFGGGGAYLISVLEPGACVIMATTVKSTWARSASERFHEVGIRYVDCPLSGGPVRARAGKLTIMVSGCDDSLEKAMPIVRTMGEDVHVITGGAGMGSTVKMCHQLLAGVHICAAAEALSMATKAGVEPEQMYRVVTGAAGNSWMFQDRGKRMIESSEPETFMKLNDHLTDLANINQEAIQLMCHTPLANAALQQFVSAQAMGMGNCDDSTVVKAYERVSGVPVCPNAHDMKDEKKNEFGGRDGSSHLV